MPTPKAPPRHPWQPLETERLRTYYPAAAAASNIESLLPHFPGRAAQALRIKAVRLGLTTPYAPWSEAHHALALAHYPTKGGAYVAELTGRTVGAVHLYCHKNSIRFIQPERPAPRPAVRHSPVPKAANTLKPLEIKGAATKASPGTPVLNAKKAERIRSEKAVEQASIVEAIRDLPPGSEGRAVYTRTAALHGGPAATAARRPRRPFASGGRSKPPPHQPREGRGGREGATSSQGRSFLCETCPAHAR